MQTRAEGMYIGEFGNDELQRLRGYVQLLSSKPGSVSSFLV